MKQIKFAFNNIDKLNLRLIKIFMYLFQFAFDIYYKSNKQHIESNILSRLSFNIKLMKWIIYSNFDVDKRTLNIIYHVFLIKIIKLLTKDLVENNSKNWINFENLYFKYRDNLIYYLSDNKLNDDRERLCIFEKFIKDIFALIHD